MSKIDNKTRTTTVQNSEAIDHSQEPTTKSSEATERSRSVPNGWVAIAFEDCLEKVTYTKKIKRKEFLEFGKIPVISQEQEYINGYWNNSDDLFSIKKPVVIFGDHTKVIKYVDFNFVLGADGVKILQTKNNIEPKYLYYYLHNIELGDLGYARHYRLLKETKIYYPKSLSEQTRIVSILDKAFAAIEQSRKNAEQNLKNAKEIFESYLNRVFDPSTHSGQDWEEKKLGEVCDIIMGQSPKGTSYNSNDVGVPLINGPVEFGKESFSKTKRIKFTTEPTKFCKEGDLILCVRGSTTGRINIAGFEACIGRGVAAIRYPANQLWINYFILSSRQYIYNLGTGATFPNVSSQILRNIKLPIPPLEIQKQIVKQLDQLQAETKKMEKIYKKKISNLEELKKSILQKAFRGEL